MEYWWFEGSLDTYLLYLMKMTWFCIISNKEIIEGQRE